MSEDDRWFRITAVVPMAVVQDTGDEAPLPELGASSPADRARRVLQRMRGRMDPDVREVVLALVDGMAALEYDLRRLQQKLLLYEAGISLQSELATLGADGVSLPRHLSWPQGTAVHVILTLDVRGREHVLILPAQVAVGPTPDSTELTFTDTRQDQRDLIVAFGFQQQAKERRRDRDAAGTP